MQATLITNILHNIPIISIKAAYSLHMNTQLYQLEQHTP
jgi:hypothetical protein